MTAPVSADSGSWLIRGRDADGRTIYYAGGGAFHHERGMAVKFQTRKAAELRSFGLADWDEVETVPA